VRQPGGDNVACVAELLLIIDLPYYFYQPGAGTATMMGYGQP
jgi:hypothetical protein